MKLEAADFAALDDSQRSAVLEALVGALTADGVVGPEEVARFDQIVLAYPWGIKRDVLVAMVKGIKARLAEVKTPAQANDFVASITARLPSPALRDKLFATMASLALADGQINRKEAIALELFMISFGITSERMAAIKAAVTGKPATPVAPTGN